MIVDLHPTADQQLVAESIGNMLTRLLPVERLRHENNWRGGAERRIWNEFVELGLFGLGLPETEGGVGYGLPEEILAARAMGRHLASCSIIATMLAAHLAATAGDDALRDAFISGSVRAGFAHPLYDGEVQLLDATDADMLVVLADDGAVLVDLKNAKARRPVELIDETLAAERASLPSLAPGNRLVAEHASLLLAAVLVGNAQATVDMAVGYAGTREQFGRAIGAFQAIKHMCADMAVRAAAAEAQVFHTAATVGVIVSSDIEIAAARLLSADAALTNAKANIQIHGGMGFTAECDAHLYLKHAHVVATLGSSRRKEQQLILGAHMSIDPAGIARVTRDSPSC